MTEIEIVESALKEMRDLQHHINTVVDNLTSGLAELRAREAQAGAKHAEERLRNQQEVNALVGRVLDRGLELMAQAVQQMGKAEATPNRKATRRARS